jgi:hypothetical protein
LFNEPGTVFFEKATNGDAASSEKSVTTSTDVVLPLQTDTFSYVSLKGQYHEVFAPRFFSSNNPPKAIVNGLKPFRIWLRIRRENRFENPL